MHASHHDSLGNAVSLADPDSLGPLNDFVEGFIACEGARGQCLAGGRHRPQSAGAGLLCRAAHVCRIGRRAGQRPAFHRGRAPAPPCRITPREQRFVEAVAQPGSRATCRARSRCTRNRRASTRATWPRSSSGSTTCSTSATRPACCASCSRRCTRPPKCLICTAWRPSPGSNATCWSRLKRRRAARWPSSPRSPGPSTRWRT
jgi:hypothetical protein